MYRFLPVFFLFIFIVGVGAQDAEGTGADSVNAPQEEVERVDLLAGVPESGQERYDALQERAVAAQESGDVSSALLFFEEMQKIAPDSGEIMYNRGTLYLAQGMVDRAVSLFSRAEDLGYGEAQLFYNRGNALFTAGDYQRAREDYQTALEIAPDDPEILNNLGVTESRLKMYDPAEEHLNRAAEIDPGYADPLFHLSIVYEATNDVEQAILAVSEALDRNDLFLEAYFRRGILHYRGGEYQKAVEDFLSARELQPEDTDILYNLGVSAIAAATGEEPVLAETADE